MDSKTFDEHLKLLQALEKEVLGSKADEYAHGDRLSNFYDAAQFNYENPSKSLWGMVTKHIIALRDFIFKLGRFNKTLQPEQFFEKLGDIRNYMYLLSAIEYDRNPEYKEYFDDRTKHLHELQTTSPTQKGGKRRG